MGGEGGDYNKSIEMPFVFPLKNSYLPSKPNSLTTFFLMLFPNHFDPHESVVTFLHICIF